MKIGKFTNVVILAFIWAFLLVAQGYSNQTFSSFSTGFFMFAIALVLLLIRMAVNGSLRSLFNVKPVIVPITIIGLFCAFSNLCSFYGFKHGDPQVGAFLLKTDVLLVSIGSVFVYKERFAKRDVICGLSMFAGVLMMLNINFQTMTFGVADLFFVANAVFVSVNVFLISYLLKQTKVPMDSYSVAFYNSLVGAIFFGVMIVVTGDVYEIPTAFAHPDVMLALVGCGVFQYLLFVSYYKALKEVPAWLVKVILLIVPIITMICNYFIYGTLPTTMGLIGGAIILVSGYGVLKNQSKKE